MNSRELARMLGISQATVSRALNGSPLVTEETKNMVLQKASELGFELNSHARGLKTNRTGTIGILFSKFFKGMSGTPMLAYLYDCIQRELIKHDYDIMLIYDYAQTGGISVFERVIKKRKVDGLLTIRAILGEPEMALIKEHNFPCVPIFMARQRQEVPYSSYSDLEHGGLQAGRFFGAFPDFEPMYIGFDGEELETALRLRGYRRGLAEHGRKLSAKNNLASLMTYDSGFQAAQNIIATLGSRKLAILAYNDLTALGILNAFRESGIDVPGQVQIIGFDDIPLASWVRPHLSTLHAAIEEMVPDACNVLRDLIEGRSVSKQKTRYKPILIHRDTTLNGHLSAREKTPENKT